MNITSHQHFWNSRLGLWRKSRRCRWNWRGIQKGQKWVQLKHFLWVLSWRWWDAHFSNLQALKLQFLVRDVIFYLGEPRLRIPWKPVSDPELNSFYSTSFKCSPQWKSMGMRLSPWWKVWIGRLHPASSDCRLEEKNQDWFWVVSCSLPIIIEIFWE